MPTSSPDARLIQTFTGRAEQPIRSIIWTAATLAQAAIVLEDLNAIIARGGTLEELRFVVQIDTMLGRMSIELQPLFERLLFRASSAAEPVFAASLGLAPLTDLGVFRAAAVNAARTEIGTLIQGIGAGRYNAITGVQSRGQLEIVRDLVAEGYQLGRTVEQIATLIKDVVGLDDRRATALAKYEAELIADGVDGGELEALVAKEGRKKLRSRARAIAATKSVRAGAIANEMIWNEHVRDGSLNPNLYEVEFVAEPRAFDRRVCPSQICARTNKMRRPIDGTYPGGLTVPLHVNCRCSERIRRRV